MSDGLGYRWEIENHAQLAATSSPLSLAYGAYAAPPTICHRPWRRKRVKFQGSMGSCTGASRASGGEVLNYIASGGGLLTLSTMYCYLQNQIESGLIGHDQGATIDGSVRAAMRTGFALEETFPYPNPVRYSTEIPPPATAEGKLHLVAKHMVMRSYDDCFTWLSSGVGDILIGVPWLQGMTQVGPTMELSDLSGHMLGGHAMLIHGYGGEAAEPMVDRDGRPYLDLENSHGAQWGEGGFCLISPRVIDYWIQNRATLIGISDMTTYGPRQIATYQEWLG